MKFTVTALATALISAAVAIPAAAGVGATIAYDTTYDNGGLSINSVACSDGQYGLGTKGYKTLGALPKFPNVAAVETIPGTFIERTEYEAHNTNRSRLELSELRKVLQALLPGQDRVRYRRGPCGDRFRD